MIYKFDHLTYVTSLKRIDRYLSGKETVFYEKQLRNPEIKSMYMTLEQSFHNLYYTFKGRYPIEYVVYEQTFGETGIRFDGDIIHAQYTDQIRAVEYLKTIVDESRIRIEDTIVKCNIAGVIDHMDYIVELTPSDSISGVNLDMEGYGAVGLIVDNLIISEIKDGTSFTECEKLIVNGRELEIRFLFSDFTDLVFELIRVIK